MGIELVHGSQRLQKCPRGLLGSRTPLGLLLCQPAVTHPGPFHVALLLLTLCLLPGLLFLVSLSLWKEPHGRHLLRSTLGDLAGTVGTS